MLTLIQVRMREHVRSFRSIDLYHRHQIYFDFLFNSRKNECNSSMLLNVANARHVLNKEHKNSREMKR